MPKSEKQKLKTLYVAEYFLKNTDENHPTTIKDIIDYLETEHDILAERRSVLRDILILRDEFGMDIECPTQGGSYYRLLSRDFELDDLKLLVFIEQIVAKSSKYREMIKRDFIPIFLQFFILKKRPPQVLLRRAFFTIFI